MNKEELKTYFKSDDFYYFVWEEFITSVIYEKNKEIFKGKKNILKIDYFTIENEDITLYIEFNILPVFYNSMIKNREFEEEEVKKMTKQKKIRFFIRFIEDFLNDGEPGEFIMNIIGFKDMIETIKYSYEGNNKEIENIMKEVSIEPQV